ncbi:hypothetical protein CYMTET_20386 [Cymbomonas tetramitiformis]|uniref:Uncharacterized protein n=1 Tax=Cymbomonas tetramitiformis TaxID=36881 RepID=A0AAE0G484_9CHLO|nr:hypothetical protein CYMTET_20386 [Cymbomonas tetramitiformis]
MLDKTFYQPVVSRLLLHDQRAAHDLYTIHQWVRECYTAHVKAGTVTTSAHRYSHVDGTSWSATSTPPTTPTPPVSRTILRTMVLDLKRQLATLTDPDEYPPAPCGFTPRAGKTDRRMKTSMPSTTTTPRNSTPSAWLLAGGKPDIVADISACSFCEEDGECMISAIDEYTDMARQIGTGVLNVNTFTADVPVVSEAVKHSPAASVGSVEDWTGPPDTHPVMPPPVTRSFADYFIASTGFTVEAPDEPPAHMNMLSAIEPPESATGYATSNSDDEGYAPEQPPASQPPTRAYIFQNSLRPAVANLSGPVSTSPTSLEICQRLEFFFSNFKY